MDCRRHPPPRIRERLVAVRRRRSDRRIGWLDCPAFRLEIEVGRIPRSGFRQTASGHRICDPGVGGRSSVLAGRAGPGQRCIDSACGGGGAGVHSPPGLPALFLGQAEHHCANLLCGRFHGGSGVAAFPIRNASSAGRGAHGGVHAVERTPLCRQRLEALAEFPARGARVICWKMTP